MSEREGTECYVLMHGYLKRTLEITWVLHEGANNTKARVSSLEYCVKQREIYYSTKPTFAPRS
jgi:hypothetical protein